MQIGHNFNVIKVYLGFFLSTSLKENQNKPKKNPVLIVLLLVTVLLHSKKCWVVSTQIWVKYGQTQMLG